MKRLFLLLLLCGAVISWMAFVKQGREIMALDKQLTEAYELAEDQERIKTVEHEIEGKRAMRIFTGLLLTFLTAGIVGLVLVVYLLPLFAQKLTHAVYDSGELLEKDLMREAHSLLAQGEYELAIEAFKKVASEDPYNRLPWVEIAKVYRVNLHDPTTALSTLREALESKDWPVDDAAYLMFRIAELYDEDFDDRATATGIMHQVVEEFPETRHSANAAHKLREWEAEEQAAARLAEEQAFMDSQQASGDDGDAGRS